MKKSNSSWFLFSNSGFARRLRHLRGEDALSDDELMAVLQRGKDIFWFLRNSKKGLQVRILTDNQVAHRLGVKITEESRQIPITVLLSDEALAEALAGLEAQNA